MAQSEFTQPYPEVRFCRVLNVSGGSDLIGRRQKARILLMLALILEAETASCCHTDLANEPSR